MKTCNTVGEIKQALANLPDDMPFRVVYEGHSCLGETLFVRGVIRRDGEERLIIDADDDDPHPRQAGQPVYPGVVPVDDYQPGVSPQTLTILALIQLRSGQRDRVRYEYAAGEHYVWIWSSIQGLNEDSNLTFVSDDANVIRESLQCEYEDEPALADLLATLGL